MGIPDIGKEIKFEKVFSSQDVINFANTTEDNQIQLNKIYKVQL